MKSTLIKIYSMLLHIFVILADPEMNFYSIEKFNFFSFLLFWNICLHYLLRFFLEAFDSHINVFIVVISVFFSASLVFLSADSANFCAVTSSSLFLSLLLSTLLEELFFSKSFPVPELLCLYPIDTSFTYCLHGSKR